MRLISNEDYEAMERLLADLLPHCDEREEVALLGLHNRLESIFASQSDLQSARDRLMALQSRKAQ